MEFPDLGKNCSESSCKRLDFLPIKCDACSGIFCHDHMMYTAHKCPSAHTKDVQVPVCPLCSQPVPVARNKLPDEVVGAHMDNDCQSEPAQARRKSEDEALAHALAASMQVDAPPASPSVPTATTPLSQEEEDRQLALAIAQSERDQRPPQRTQQQTEKSCLLS